MSLMIYPGQNLRFPKFTKVTVAEIPSMSQRYAITRPNARNVQFSTLHQNSPKLVKLHRKDIIVPHTATYRDCLRPYIFIKISLFLKQLAKINKPKAFRNMLSQIMSNYNYVAQPDTITKVSEKASAPDTSPTPKLETANLFKVS